MKLTDAEILSLAKEPISKGDGGYLFDTAKQSVIEFARAIEAAAYERAAMVCETLGKWESDRVKETTDDCAKAIRALAKEPT